MDKGFLFSRKMWALIMVLLVVLMAAAAFALQFSEERAGSQPAVEQRASGSSSDPATGVSKAVFKVDNMTCSGVFFPSRVPLRTFPG